MKMKYLALICLAFFVIAAGCTKIQQTSQVYFLNSVSGDDSSDGRSPETAWKTLARASQPEYFAGDQLLLCSGCTFKGKLELNAKGAKENPVVVSSYHSDGSESNLPVIDAKGYVSAISIKNGRYIQISNLELTSDAGTPVDSEAQMLRYGVYIEASEPGEFPGITLDGLKIHNIFATENKENDGQNSTSNMGYGIFALMKNGKAKISHLKITNCTIEKTGHTGIRIFGDRASNTYLDGVTITNNYLEHIGGPGMVPGLCENVLVSGNVVNYSGSDIDPRMHNRGSGIWPWTCNNVLIEKNKFMHARGKADSCGAHIDFNCSNVTVQYNLSMDNAGGFVEILGNDKNCCYRYNISINDGFRIKGENGAHQEGKVLWTSGYTGRGSAKTGPFNSYVYNNTVFVKEDIRSCFSFTKTTDGILIANNVFYISGTTADVSDDQDTRVAGGTIAESNVVFKNNLYKSAEILPASLPIKDSYPFIGDPQFKNPGGFEPQDYIPQNIDVIKDRGIQIDKLPGDSIGVVNGLAVDTDFFGNKIKGQPDLGAIELQ